MNIYYCTPFSIEKNLGKAFNDYVKRLTIRPDDWIFLLDGDTSFLDPFWGKHISDLVHKYPHTGIFTCYTNRVGNLLQCHKFKRSDDSNMINHFRIAQQLKQNYYWNVREINHIISGHLMGFSRKTWEDVGGFTENPGEILKVDNRFSKRVLNSGRKILLMEGVYLFHYYRLHELNPRKAKKHLL